MLVLSLVLGTAGHGALGSPAVAGEGERWDDRHMQSRHRSLVDPKPARKGVEGQTRFDQLEKGQLQKASTTVPAQLEHVSQRAWEGVSGGPSLDSSRFQGHTSTPIGSIPRNSSDGHGRSSNRSGRSRGSR